MYFRYFMYHIASFIFVRVLIDGTPPACVTSLPETNTWSRGTGSVGEGSDLFRLLLEFGNRVVDRLGPGLVVLVRQIDLARRQVRLHELVGRLLPGEIDDHHARLLAGGFEIADDHFRLGDLARLRVALRFERQRQFD